MGAVAEGIGQARRGDAEDEPLTVVGQHLGVLGQEGPRGPTHLVDAAEDVRPGPTQGLDVEVGSPCGGCRGRRRLGLRGRRGLGRLAGLGGRGRGHRLLGGCARRAGRGLLRVGGLLRERGRRGGRRGRVRGGRHRGLVPRGRLLRSRGRLAWRGDGRGAPFARRHSPDLEAPLEAVQPGRVAGLAGGRRQQHPGCDDLQLDPRRGRARHLRQAGVDDVRGARERCRPEGPRLLPHALDLVTRQTAEDPGGTVGRRGDDDEVAESLEQVLDEAPGVEAGLDDRVDDREDAGGVPGGEGGDRPVEQLAVGEAEQRSGAVVGQPLVGAAGDELVEDGQRVTHRTATGTDDEGEDPRLDRNALGRAELLHVVLEPRRGHEPEGVVVGPRADGADDLLRLGRREDELHVLGRLLDDLEQGVEALRRHHVRLVDDVDLVAALRGAEGRPLAQVTGVVDTAVARRVDLDDVDRPGAAARQRRARVALAARGRCRALLAVEAPGEDAGARRLAAAPWAREEVGVVDPPRAERLHQGLGHVLLPDDVGEALGPVTAVQGGAHGLDPTCGDRQRPPPWGGRCGCSRSGAKGGGRPAELR